MRAEYVLLLLALLAVLAAVLAAVLPASAEVGECHVDACDPGQPGGNCNCLPVAPEPDPPISEEHSIHFWAYLPAIERAGVG